MNLELSRQAAEYSRLAYDDDLSSSNVVARTFENENARAYVLRDKFAQWVVVRGTNDKKDWLENLDSDITDLGLGVKAHKGFVEHAQKVRYVLSTLSVASPTVFTGHSLGGVAATALAFWWRFHGAKSQSHSKVITFGSPRLFARRNAPIGLNIERWVIPGDLAPCFPRPRRFEHTGRLNLVEPNGVILNERAPWYMRLRNFFRSIFESIGLIKSIRMKHSSKEYEKRVEFALKRYGV